MSMTEDDTIEPDVAEEVAAILLAGGFKPLTQGPEAGRVCRQVGTGWWLGGEFPATPHTPAHSRACYGDPIEAAHELVAHARSFIQENPLSLGPADLLETPQAANESLPDLGEDIVAAEEEMGENLGDDQNTPVPTRDAAQADPDLQDEGSDGVEGAAVGLGEYGGGEGDRSFDEADLRSDSDVIDADYEAFGGRPALTDEEHIQSVASPGNTGQGGGEGDTGGVAYFGDNINVIRLAKIGRVTQIARDLKAALQDGWTVEDFASLQGYVVANTNEIGTFIGDPAIYADFIAVSDKIAAQRRIDGHANTQIAFIETASREDVEAFDPEAGWP